MMAYKNHINTERDVPHLSFKYWYVRWSMNLLQNYYHLKAMAYEPKIHVNCHDSRNINLSN